MSFNIKKWDGTVITVSSYERVASPRGTQVVYKTEETDDIFGFETVIPNDDIKEIVKAE
jgi:hypothetical protein